MSDEGWIGWVTASLLVVVAAWAATRPPGGPARRLSGPSGADRGGPDGPPPVAPLPDHLLGEVAAALIEAGSPPAGALRHLGLSLAAVSDPRAEVWLRAGAALLHTPSAGGIPGSATGPVAGHDAMAAAVTGALLLAGRSGLPPADVVRECASAERRARAERSARHLARLPVLLVLPLGLCLLPASALLGVAPVVIGLLTELRL